MSTPFIVFASEVTELSTSLLASNAVQLSRHHDKVNVVIQTMGGGFEYAVFAYHLLRGLPCHMTTINLGVVGSSGVTIYLAGDKRLCTVGSGFGFHKFNGQFPQGVSIPGITRDIYVDRTEMDSSIADTLVGDAGSGFGDVVLRHDWAIDKGVAHELVSSFEIPRGSTVISI